MARRVCSQRALTEPPSLCRRDGLNSTVGADHGTRPIAVRHNDGLSAARGYGRLVSWAASCRDRWTAGRLEDLTRLAARRRLRWRRGITRQRWGGLLVGKTGLIDFWQGGTAGTGVRRRGRCSDAPTEWGTGYWRFRSRRQPARRFQVLKRWLRCKRTRPDIARFGCQWLGGTLQPLHATHILAIADWQIGIVAPGEWRIPPGLVPAAAKHQRKGERGDTVHQ
jgi:hypothetical protein